MEEAGEIVESTPVEMPSRRRIDWRTGKKTVWQPRSFWEEHERRRAASGLSIAQPLQSVDAGSHLMPATPRFFWLMWSLRMGTRVCTLISKLCRHMACSFFNAFSFR